MSKRNQTLEEAKAHIHKYVAPGDTIYSITRRISRSRNSRWIDFFVIRDNEPYFLTWDISVILDKRCTGNGDGLLVRGVGFNHAESIVETLEYRLYGALGIYRCRSL